MASLKILRFGEDMNIRKTIDEQHSDYVDIYEEHLDLYRELLVNPQGDDFFIKLDDMMAMLHAAIMQSELLFHYQEEEEDLVDESYNMLTSANDLRELHARCKRLFKMAYRR